MHKSSYSVEPETIHGHVNRAFEVGENDKIIQTSAPTSAGSGHQNGHSKNNSANGHRVQLPNTVPISTISASIPSSANINKEKDLEKTGEDPPAPDREVWNNQLEFLLSCIAMSVGLGNIWRFPFTAYENGGGAFLIPYLIVLFFIGKPIYFLELAVGQFSSYGQVKIWKMAPFFKGVGYGSAIGTSCVVSYYCSLMALTVYYFFASFQAVLPWSECSEDWTGPLYVCNSSDTVVYANNITVRADKSVPQLYFENEVLKQIEDIDHGIGLPEWRLTLCLLFSWLVIYFSIVKGVKSAGKVAYFTALFPYVVLIILLIRGVTLPGAWTGIKYFIEPKWSKIYDPNVWYAAVGQCFFSLSTGFGPIIMFSSYNPFRHNVYRDAMIISLMDTFTSLLAGFTIFAILGSLAFNLNVEIDEVARAGPGLAFVSYPEAIAKFDFLPQLFSVLFFLMLFTLGVGSATSLAGGVITVIVDQFPQFTRFKVTTAICIGGFLVGLIYVTPGGQFMLTLVDYFGANFVIYIMATVEIIGVSWVYGLNNFCKDIEFMLNIKVNWYWKFCWGFFVPVSLVLILVYSLSTQGKLTHQDVEFPDIAIAFGWVLAIIALSVLPICAIHAVKTRKSHTLKEKFFEAFKPSKGWGPKDPELRREWELFKAKKI